MQHLRGIQTIIHVVRTLFLSDLYLAEVTGFVKGKRKASVQTSRAAPAHEEHGCFAGREGNENRKRDTLAYPFDDVNRLLR